MRLDDFTAATSFSHFIWRQKMVAIGARAAELGLPRLTGSHEKCRKAGLLPSVRKRYNHAEIPFCRPDGRFLRQTPPGYPKFRSQIDHPCERIQLVMMVGVAITPLAN